MLKKLLFSLGTLGVVGGTGVGVYYGIDKGNSEVVNSSISENSVIERDQDVGSQEADDADSDSVESRRADLAQNIGKDGEKGTPQEPLNIEKTTELQASDVDSNSVNNSANIDLTSVGEDDLKNAASADRTSLLAEQPDLSNQGTLEISDPETTPEVTSERPSTEKSPEEDISNRESENSEGIGESKNDT